MVWRLTAVDGRQQVLAVEPRLAAGDLETLAAAAVEGVGVALLPEADCRAELAAGRLIHVLPEWSAVGGILHLVFTSRRSMLPGVRAVIEFAAAALSDAIS